MKLSVVSPVYNSAPLISELVSRVRCALKSDFEGSFELVLVDDGSTDGSWAAICEAARNNAFVVAAKLSRNFGQHTAIAAGLDLAQGDAVVVMDCDLQDRPEEIPRLYEQLLGNDNVDCVIALREDRKDSFFKKLGSRLFYLLLNILTGMKLDSRAANFGIYTRRFVSHVCQCREVDRSFPFLVHWVGFQKAYLAVQHDPRPQGKSGYTFWALVKLSLSIGMAVSDRPMKIVMGFGLLLSGSAFLKGLSLLYSYFMGQISEPGYASIVLSIWFFSGVITLVLGLIGLYIGRIFLATKSRPLYIFDVDPRCAVDE